MNPDLGHMLTVWTIRLSVALYAGAVWWMLSRRRASANKIFQTLWGGAWLLCVVHVICAFHFQHHWSHAAAIKHTADVTERVLGIRSDMGVFVNYAFLVWWGTDFLRGLTQQRTRPSVSLQVAAAFMMFNATAVFGPVWWWVPVAVFGVFMAISVRVYRRRMADSSEFPANDG